MTEPLKMEIRDGVLYVEGGDTFKWAAIPPAARFKNEAEMELSDLSIEYYWRVDRSDQETYSSNISGVASLVNKDFALINLGKNSVTKLNAKVYCLDVPLTATDYADKYYKDLSEYWDQFNEDARKAWPIKVFFQGRPFAGAVDYTDYSDYTGLDIYIGGAIYEKIKSILIGGQMCRLWLQVELKHVWIKKGDEYDWEYKEHRTLYFLPSEKHNMISTGRIVSLFLGEAPGQLKVPITEDFVNKHQEPQKHSEQPKTPKESLTRTTALWFFGLLASAIFGSIFASCFLRSPFDAVVSGGLGGMCAFAYFRLLNAKSRST
jgi:hypothetical protein